MYSVCVSPTSLSCQKRVVFNEKINKFCKKFSSKIKERREKKMH